MPDSEKDEHAVPTLDSPYPLQATDVESFRERGHVHLRGVASPDELSVYAPAIVNTALEQNRETRTLDDRDAYGRAFLQMINLWLVDRRVQAFVFSRRFARIAAELLGVESVRLYHDQALFKEPSGGYTPWHQDQYYWPLDTEETITLWMPLSPIPPEIGGMRFVSGSHRLGHLGDHAIGDRSHEIYDALIRERGLPVDSVAELDAGDATFHHGWTLHSAGPNPTSELRPAMTIIYFKDGVRVSSLDHRARRMDRAMYLPQCAEGEIAAGPFCPRLHPREADALPDPPERTSDYWKQVIAVFRETEAKPSD